MKTIAALLDATGMAEIVNAYDWIWPVCEILHFAGMALLIGTIGFVDLRILGFGKGLPVHALERLLPIGVAGFVVNTATGFVFVAGNPVGGALAYLENLAFQLKMLLILLAGINVACFYLTGIARAAAAAGAAGDAAPSAKVVAGASLVFWVGVIVFGRLIMYNDTLLYALGL
ncbi:MAG TPA: hypothetical protein VF339_12405 [Gammaproteobacteria bacterium]